MRPPASPRIFDYEDFRNFLQDFYAHEKTRVRGFSYAVFARRAGLSSRSHLKLVMDYGMSLSPSVLEGYLRALRLSGPEAEYFRLLTRHPRIETPSERQVFLQAIRAFRHRHNLRELSGREFSGFQASWARLLVLSLTRIRGFRADPPWIHRKLGGRVTQGQAGHALRFLRRKGYLRLRGGRVVYTAAGTLSALDRNLSGKVRIRSMIHRESTRPRPRPLCEDVFAFSVLKQEEAKAFQRRYLDWLFTNLPRHKGKVDGNLCVVHLDVVPLSD